MIVQLIPFHDMATVVSYGLVKPTATHLARAGQDTAHTP
jgi:hypothetical protein